MQKRLFRGEYAVQAWLLAATLTVAAVPLCAYGIARVTGALPSKAAWDRLTAGTNSHGPWQGDLHECIVSWPVMTLVIVLPLITMACSIFLTNGFRLARSLLLGGLLWLLQWALAFGVLIITYWTVD